MKTRIDICVCTRVGYFNRISLTDNKYKARGKIIGQINEYGVKGEDP
jgi:hypothetical protein